MAIRSVIRIISIIVLIEFIFFTSTEANPLIAMSYMDDDLSSLPSSIFHGSGEPVKLIRKPRSLEQEPANKAQDDLETAAGTNLLRPLFVYRQQMESRARHNRKAIGRRHALYY